MTGISGGIVKPARILSRVPILSVFRLLLTAETRAQEAFMKPAATIEEYAKNAGESVRPLKR